jgi:hypothetical protein
MAEEHGPYHRRGGPGGPASRLECLPVVRRLPNGAHEEAILVDAQDGGELEMLRAVVASLGIAWGGDDIGWWAAVPSGSMTFALPSHGHNTWAVWRQDDNGNAFQISGGHSAAEAERICAEFEARGHKQHYWMQLESSRAT